MNTFWMLWAGTLALILSVATWMEYSAIHQRINGANGLTLLVAGIVSALSLPVGGAIAWYLGGFAAAAKMTLATGAGVATVFYGALRWLDSQAKQPR
ncbi:hypothetical protein DEH84_11670 [Aquabacterium olei]|uniref:Uncharacterized protein n=1 Tax=Aquabacterium olei TaxID=1296669 RepID=A0A2U8FSM3_9BURK|nr:hypothetical protein [Aquabacterium olei]AWI54010.1 hypothetical protein DEH84_11670 [Aquabacterium olei]